MLHGCDLLSYHEQLLSRRLPCCKNLGRSPSGRIEEGLVINVCLAHKSHSPTMVRMYCQTWGMLRRSLFWDHPGSSDSNAGEFSPMSACYSTGRHCIPDQSKQNDPDVALKQGQSG